MRERQVQITTSAWLTNPEGAFYAVGRVNKELPADSKIGIEVYPVAHRLPISERTAAKLPFFKNLVESGFGFAFRDGRVSADKLKGWESEHGVKVERVHLPFHYSIPTGLFNYCYYLVFNEPGSKDDRYIASAVAYMTMTAMNNFATRLAGELGAGLNAHRNIIEEAEKRGKLGKIQGKSRYTWVENDLDYPREDVEQMKAERDVKKTIDAITRNSLGGLIYGVDHAYRAKVDPREDFENFREEFKIHLRTLHVSGSKGDHGLIAPDDHEFWDLIKFVSPLIPDDVIFCLDLDPIAMGAKTQDEQVDYLREIIGPLRSF